VSTATPVRLPKGLAVSLSDIDHGYAITALAQVSWPPIGETGGPLTAVFHKDALVLMQPDRHQGDSAFYLRGVAYHIRVDFSQSADGAWDLTHSYITRPGWVKIADMYPSSAAKRDLLAILEQVAREIIDARSDLFLDAAVEAARKDANGAAARVEQLRKDLREAEQALHDADAALVAAKITREVPA
jgi:hypothetical protein